MRVPIGIEKLLVRAAADPELKTRLLADRATVLAEFGDEVNGPEAEILKSIPIESLAAMVDRIDLERHPKKRFMKGVVRAALVAAAATAMIGCGDDSTSESFSTGISPDWPPADDVKVGEVADPSDVTNDGTVEPELIAVDAGTSPPEEVEGEDATDVVDAEVIMPNAGVPAGDAF